MTGDHRKMLAQRIVKPPGGDVATGHGYHGVPTRGRAYDSYGSTYPIGQGEMGQSYSGKRIAFGSHVIHPRGFKASRAQADFDKR